MSDPTNVTTLCAVGDVALCDRVEQGIETHGAGFPVQQMLDVLLDKDISIANLEHVFTDRETGITAQAHLLKSGVATAETIVQAGIDVVSLANNHIMDYGAEALSQTIAVLEERRVGHCGAGNSLRDARRPVIVESNGISFGFLAYAMKGVQSAHDDQAGAAWIDYEMIAEDVGRLRDSVDHVIVSLHAGLEFIDYPHPDHRELCLRVADLGPRLIIGHHPHVIHGIERTDGGCLIAYSLGNLVFDTALMDYRTERAREGLILKCTFDKERLLDFETHPTWIGDDSSSSLADDERRERVLERLDKISKETGSNLYPKVYFDQASRIWPKINIAVNLRVIREQGLLAFAKRLPRLKPIYAVLLVKYLARKALSPFRRATD